MTLDLRAIISRFCENWGPKDDAAYHRFVDDLRELVEAYGAAALLHQSLPDNEHKHGDPI